MKLFPLVTFLLFFTACSNVKDAAEETDAVPVITNTETAVKYDSAVSVTDTMAIKKTQENKTSVHLPIIKSGSENLNGKKAASEELSEIETDNEINIAADAESTPAESGDAVEKGIRNPVSRPNAAVVKETSPAVKNNSTDKMKTLFKK